MKMYFVRHFLVFQVGKGQFIQFFAPKYPSTVKKDIIFILDVSGSMSGSKLIHTKNAMYKIVDALNPGDRFNIMTFSNYLRFWNRNAIQEVTEKNKKKAKTFITEMLADGGMRLVIARLLFKVITSTSLNYHQPRPLCTSSGAVVMTMALCLIS